MSYAVIQSIVSRAGPYIISFVIALVSFLGGAVTDVGQTVQIAITPEKALVQAAELIKDTPSAEVQEVLKEEAEKGQP